MWKLNHIKDRPTGLPLIDSLSGRQKRQSLVGSLNNSHSINCPLLVGYCLTTCGKVKHEHCKNTTVNCLIEQPKLGSFLPLNYIIYIVSDICALSKENIFTFFKASSWLYHAFLK